jgi:hypothetical protein
VSQTSSAVGACSLIVDSVVRPAIEASYPHLAARVTYAKGELGKSTFFNKVDRPGIIVLDVPSILDDANVTKWTNPTFNQLSDMIMSRLQERLQIGRHVVREEAYTAQKEFYMGIYAYRKQ